MSDFLFGSGRHDDLTLPYYARNGFDPQKIVSLVQEKAADGEHPLVFVTFDADYPSILFPGSCTDLPENTFLTDLPNKPPVANLDFHTGSVYLVTSGEADLAAENFVHTAERLAIYEMTDSFLLGEIGGDEVFLSAKPVSGSRIRKEADFTFREFSQGLGLLAGLLP